MQVLSPTWYRLLIAIAPSSQLTLRSERGYATRATSVCSSASKLDQRRVLVAGLLYCSTTGVVSCTMNVYSISFKEEGQHQKKPAGVAYVWGSSQWSSTTTPVLYGCPALAYAQSTRTTIAPVDNSCAW